MCEDARSDTGPSITAPLTVAAVGHRRHAFLVSGIIAGAGEQVVGEDYVDADGARYLPMLVQSLLVFVARGAAGFRS